MMNAFQKKVTLKVLGIHVLVVFMALIVPLMQSCFRPKPREIITFVNFADAPPSVSVAEVSRMSDPKPPEPEPTPEQVPEPEPVKPEPIKPEPAPVIPKNPEPKPKPKPKPEPVKPKPTYTRPEDIKIGKRVDKTPKAPTVSQQDIAAALNNIQQPAKNTGAAGNPNEHAAYDALIHRTFNNAWAKPASPAIRPAKVTVSISPSGRVISVQLKQSSGDAAFDATVMSAARSVKTMSRKPPLKYPRSRVVVFEIVN